MSVLVKRKLFTCRRGRGRRGQEEAKSNSYADLPSEFNKRIKAALSTLFHSVEFFSRFSLFG